ncbi:MAG: hypothetical protein QM523_10600, partial [Candidatus Pacebacteria bacterium]|nr:hypothetical protein [Candidatus Paceibacterota bacterium]
MLDFRLFAKIFSKPCGGSRHGLFDSLFFGFNTMVKTQRIQNGTATFAVYPHQVFLWLVSTRQEILS